MPDSMGKRQRREVKANKAAAREERRVARARRRDDRAAGLIPAGPALGDPPDLAAIDSPEERPAEGAES